MKAFRNILITLLILFAAVTLFCGVFFAVTYVSANAIPLDENLLKKNFKNVEFFDENGDRIEFDRNSYSYTPYEELGDNTINAFVSIEDKRFFTHNGVDTKRVIKAMLKNLVTFSFKEGASTISQQLVKNTLLTNEKTLLRKIKEINLARRLEKAYSKKEILAMYLSAIYFGDGMNGIKNAAYHYFGKTPNELSVEEAATLAGMIKAPNTYSPIGNPEKTTTRRNIVLKTMTDNGYIDENYYSELKYKPINLNVQNLQSGNAYLSLAEEEAEKILNKLGTEDLSEYRVYTYFKPKLCDFVSEAKEKYANCHIVLESGGRIVYVDQSHSGLISKRTNVASLIKPVLVYAPALEENIITPATVVSDKRKDYGGYSPSNYKNLYYGNVSIRTAISKSINTVAIEVFNSLGTKKAQKYAEKLGLTLGENDGLAVALGASENGITPLEIAISYSVFQNEGRTSSFSTIDKITDSRGRIIYKYEQSGRKVFSEETAYIITSMLEETAKNGTAKALAKLPITLYAKTGTNGNDKQNFDSFSIAFDKNYIALSYLSSTNETPLPANVGGGTIPIRDLVSIFSIIETEDSPIQKPESVDKYRIDGYVAENDGKILLANENTPKKYVIEEYFDVSKAPTEYSEAFSAPTIDKTELKENDGILTLTFNSKSIYRYEVKNAFTGDTIENIEGNGKTISLNFDRESFDGDVKLEITPYVEGGAVGKSVYTDTIYKKDALI